MSDIVQSVLPLSNQTLNLTLTKWEFQRFRFRLTLIVNIHIYWVIMNMPVAFAVPKINLSCKTSFWKQPWPQNLNPATNT